MFRNLPIPQTVARTETLASQRPALQAPIFPAQSIAPVSSSMADKRRESNESLERDLKEAQRNNLDLQKKLKAAATRISVLNHNRTADAQTAEFEIAHLTKKLTQVSETNEQLTSSLNGIHKEKVRAGETTVAHQKQVAAVQVQMAAAMAERDALRATVDDMTAKQVELEATNVALKSAASVVNAATAAPPVVASLVARAPNRSVFKAQDVSTAFELALPPCPVKASSHAMSCESLGRRMSAYDFATLIGARAEGGMMEHVMSDFTNEFWRDQMFYRDQKSYGAFYPVAATV
jgi:hypothetical protein